MILFEKTDEALFEIHADVFPIMSSTKTRLKDRRFTLAIRSAFNPGVVFISKERRHYGRRTS